MAVTKTRSAAAVCLSAAALAAIVMLTFQEGHQQQLASVLEEVDPDEPINLNGAITGINPASGPFRGGNKVTITGMDLLGGSGGLADVRKVLVGGVPVRRIVSASPAEVQVVLGHRSTREHSTGPASVAIVSHSRGQTVASGAYRFNAPARIIAVRPDNGPHGGGNEVTIRGRHLSTSHDDVAVLIDGEPCKVLLQTADTLRVRVPPRTRQSRRHTAHVQVQSAAFGESTLRRSYTYNPAPAITHVSPVEGPWSGGNTLRIHGDMITSGEGRVNEKVTVLVGGEQAELLAFSPNSVTVRAPKHAAAGLVTVQVTSSLHGVSHKPKAYRYHARPVITSVHPSEGTLRGGDHVLIRGRHLGKGDIRHVYFGQRRARVLRASRDGGEVLVQTRRFSHSDAGRRVRVRLTSTTFGKIASKKVFAVGRQAAITSVTPRDGPCEGGTLITVQGRNLASKHGKTARLEGLSATVAGAAATVVERHPDHVVLKTHRCPLGATRGVVTLRSRSLGMVATPYSAKFGFNSLPIVRHLTPEVGSYEGGGEVLLRGDSLCHGTCEDLLSLRVGSAIITKFLHKSPRRIIFKAPSAQQAGGPGDKTLVLHSRRLGRAVVPQGYSIAPMGSTGVVVPSNVPMQGGAIVTIDTPDIQAAGQASQLSVELASVPAQVLSVSGSRIVVRAGDPRASPLWHEGAQHTGLAGEVVMTATIKGQKYAKDLGLPFRYNAACSIEAVAVRPGAHGGELALLIAGSHLGFGDESVTVDGAPAKVHRRERRGSNVYRHHATVAHMGGVVSYVEVQSRRSGKCVWNALHTTTTTTTTPSRADAGSPASAAKASVTMLQESQPRAVPTSRAGRADATFHTASSVAVKQPAGGHFVPQM
jgi:hypothetical protein